MVKKITQLCYIWNKLQGIKQLESYKFYSLCLRIHCGSVFISNGKTPSHFICQIHLEWSISHLKCSLREAIPRVSMIYFACLYTSPSLELSKIQQLNDGLRVVCSNAPPVVWNQYVGRNCQWWPFDTSLQTGCQAKCWIITDGKLVIFHSNWFLCLALSLVDK